MHIFVYGTLKQGFPNFAVNAGRRVGGSYRTRLPFRLYVVKLPNEDRAPWLIAGDGRQGCQGCQVSGQVFEVDSATLQAMDALEEVGQPTGYVRVAIELEAVQAPGAPNEPGVPEAPTAALSACAYLKLDHQFAACLACEGPFESYTAELAVGYRLAAA